VPLKGVHWGAAPLVPQVVLLQGVHTFPDHTPGRALLVLAELAPCSIPR